jgi:hypothetical protein
MLDLVLALQVVEVRIVPGPGNPPGSVKTDEIDPIQSGVFEQRHPTYPAKDSLEQDRAN